MRRVLRSRLSLAMVGLLAMVSLVTWALARPSATGSPATAQAGYQSGTAAAGGTAAAVPGRPTGSGTAVLGTATHDTAGPGAYPAWCCSSGNPLGLTITGQGYADGYGPRARASAIAQAVADARDQARTAASAAGIALGGVIDMQVSAPVYYPYPMGAAPGASGGVSAGASGGAPASPPGPVPSASPAAPQSGAKSGNGSAITCAYGAPCPNDGYGTSASVTITWAIG